MIREVDFRYAIVRGSADFDEIYPIEGGEPTIRMDKDAAIKMSLSGTFAPNDRVDWLTDKIRPELILDGVSYPLGIFLPASVIPVENESMKTLQVEAYDQCWLMQDYRNETPVTFSGSTKYLSAVQQLLTQAGIGVSIVTQNAATLSEIRTWEIGTSNLDIANELLAEINYKELWFNADGLPVLEPKAAPGVENIQHRLDEADVKSLLLPKISRETDIYQAPNVFICVCANPDKSSNMTATAVNDYLNSPLSVQKRGRRIVKFVKLNNIASQNELQAYANNLVRESLYVGETVKIATGLLPGYGVGDVVALNMAGVFSICIEKSWEMQLQVGGEMQHTLERVVYQYGA